jgi:hypothetical protein
MLRLLRRGGTNLGSSSREPIIIVFALLIEKSSLQNACLTLFRLSDRRLRVWAGSAPQRWEAILFLIFFYFLTIITLEKCQFQVIVPTWPFEHSFLLFHTSILKFEALQQAGAIKKMAKMSRVGQWCLDHLLSLEQFLPNWQKSWNWCQTLSSVT